MLQLPPLDEALLVSKLLGPKSEFGSLSKQLATLPKDEKQQIGVLLNECKKEVLRAIQERAGKRATEEEWFDFTAPGQRPPVGHLHIVTQAITDITRIFERIGFTRVRHPEIDTDWYAFESLNMPPDHPARDEWETFFIQSSMTNTQSPTRRKIVLTPHTSNGQVREMEKGKLPIRMINIAKCYRRQSDISHVPMFHQFEGMYIDKNVSIGHLKDLSNISSSNTSDRKENRDFVRFIFNLQNHHLKLISCSICNGTSKLPGGGSVNSAREDGLNSPDPA